jgi:hypothetical protein
MCFNLDRKESPGKDIYVKMVLLSSDADPEPHPNVLGPPGSFYHQAKIVIKTFISTVLWLLYDFLSLENYVNVASKCNKQKKL